MTKTIADLPKKKVNGQTSQRSNVKRSTVKKYPKMANMAHSSPKWRKMAHNRQTIAENGPNESTMAQND